MLGDGVLLTLAETLELPADENGGHEIAQDEEEEEDIVELWVAEGVEAREEGQADGADDGEDDG